MDDDTTRTPDPSALLAELRDQAAAAATRAAETVLRVETEISEVRDQALAVAAALASDTRSVSDITVDGDRAAETILVDARERADAIQAEAAARAAAIRADATAVADDAAAALALAQSRQRTAARQAQTLRVGASEGAAAHRAEQLAQLREEAETRVDAALAVAARLGLTLDTLSASLDGAAPGA